MVREFTFNERQLLLKFITGSSRLGPTRIIEVEISYNARNSYPIAHTCGESVELVNYSSLEVMKEKFRTAMLSCGEIDDDEGYYGSEQSSEEG
jgi:hypothetical protein